MAEVSGIHGQGLGSVKVLVVDDHRNIRLSLGMILTGEGALVSEAENYAKAMEMIDGAHGGGGGFDVMLFDIRLPDGNGIQLLREAAARESASRVIMISGEGTVSEAFEATQIGAFDYIEKPFPPERILVSVRRCHEFNSMLSSNRRLMEQVSRGDEMLGEHESVKRVQKLIKQVAPTEGRVLIRGESGTGKELVAKAIHRQSARRSAKLVKVNCAAIPHSLVESELFGHEKGAFTGAAKGRKGLFEQADGGTLFLDEIGELSLDVQAKLLRVLQNGEVTRVGGEGNVKVDVRLVTATHRDIEEMIHDGAFREDLYYRLNVVSIHLSPLRERRSDIPLLARFFLAEACETHSVGSRHFAQDALDEMVSYDWPGNIRELRNCVERIAILSEDVEICAPLELVAGGGGVRPQPGLVASKAVEPGHEGLFCFSSDVLSWQEFHQAVDRHYLQYVLDKTAHNVSEASRVLCMERAYLHRLLKKLGVQRSGCR